MKIIHVSDLHLGKGIFEQSLLDVQASALEALAALVREESPAALLIAGDIYDRAVPPPEAISLFDSFIARVKSDDPGLDIVAIPGNHDSAMRLSFGAGLLAREGVHIRTRASECAVPLIVRREAGTAFIWSLPFLYPGDFDDPPADGPPGKASPRGQADLFEEGMRRILVSMARVPEEAARILLCHAFARGGKSGDSERVFVGSAELVSTEAFAAFDYVALGHLHRSQEAAPNARYPGSIISYTFQEDSGEKGCIVADVTRGGLALRFAALEPARRMTRIRASFRDLVDDPRFDANAGDFIEAVIDEKEPVINPGDALRARFPWLLSIRQSALEGSFPATGGPEGSMPGIPGNADILDDFSAFSVAVLGAPPDAATAAEFASLAVEAGHEASQA